MATNIPLPQDTAEILKSNISKVSNFGLLFDKYVSAWTDGWEMGNQKKDFLNVLKNAASASVSKKNYSVPYSRQKRICNSLKESGWFVESFDLKTQSRLIIGLGGTNVLETGMTLHPLYGFPYIPASGLKGLARAYAEISETLAREEIREIFGSEDKNPLNVKNNRRGKVLFMDGLPNQFPKIDLDIMNPHYTEYYQGEKDSRGNLIPPGDYFNPVPIFFIAVAEGQTFSFALTSRDQEFIQKAKDCLIGGLTQLGAGGKTNVGYGYFQPPLSQSIGQHVETKNEITGETQFQGKNDLKPEKIEKSFKDVMLIYNPGKRSLETTVEGNKKAFIEHIGDSFVPEHLWPKLKKDKKIKASIIVEPQGNAYRIIKIEL